MGTADRVCTSCDTPLPGDAAFCPSCGAATPTRRAAEIPHGFLERLTAALAGRYRIEREVGRGGMALVYLAHDLRHERPVAVKVLRPELAASVGADRFLREIKLAARLTHQNVLALYDSGDADGFLYYVMPFVEGESLRQKLSRERQLSIDEALRLTREIAEGLEYAHEQGVIHRDIKPENILLSRSHAVIADFGVAKAAAKRGMSHLTSTGTSVGTPLYMSPEQAGGDPNIDHRSDIYSLGCMLYEMLAGEPPFTGPTVQAVIAKHALDPRPGVRTLRDTVPAAVEGAIRRAMAKAPADRFRTAADFAAAFEEAPGEAGEVEGAVATATPLLHPLRRRRRRALRACGIVIAAAVIAVLGYPAIRDVVGGPATRKFPDVPLSFTWTDIYGEHFPLLAVAGSTLVIHRYGADSVYVYDGSRWEGSAIPHPFALRPYDGEIHEQRLIAMRRRVDAEGNPLVQYWWLELRPDSLVPLKALGEYEAAISYSFWWSDGHELVMWLQAIRRWGASEWVPEATGSAGPVARMWGRDFTRRFALLKDLRDSLLVYDGISWQLQGIVPDGLSGRPAFTGGATLPDGSTIVFGELCGAETSCAPLLLQQDRFGERWRRIIVPAGTGIPGLQPAGSADRCTAPRFVLAGVGGAGRQDFYVWGDWTTCDADGRGPSAVGCPAGQPCVWHVADGALRPVDDLLGRVIVGITVTAGAQYALVNDGTLWRRVEGAWRRVGQVPNLPRRLVGASPWVVARWTDGSVRYEPGSADTAAGFFTAPVPGLPAPTTGGAPPRRLAVRDTTIALLSADGTVWISTCGGVSTGMGVRERALRCRPWAPLLRMHDHVSDVGILQGGQLIGVGKGGLVLVGNEDALRAEQLPREAQADSLWGVETTADGAAVAIGAGTLLERDPAGRWSVVRRFAGDGGVGKHLALLPDGDVVVAGNWMRVWSRSAEMAPVATLHQPVLGGARVGGLHVLRDGRLIAGFASPDQPAVGGWLQVWAVPARENRWQRVDLPMAIDVTDLADDGTFLYIVGSGGSTAIPLDSLPFAEQVDRH